MKIVISPAKSLDFERQLPTNKSSKPLFLKEAKIINATLKKLKPSDLSELMHISDNLAQLNWERNKIFKTPFTQENARPAIYAFNGDVYLGLDSYSIPEDKLETLQNKLRILSGQYGILKPFDLMQAYRLEMGTQLQINETKNLYEFWKESLTNTLNKELKKNELFINLASHEYFSVIDVKKLKVPVITPEFKDYKNGKLKMISFFAKKARGLMVRYIIDHNVETLDQLKAFNYEGYLFDQNLSKGNTLIFTR
ncbi:peroxide stress protein YaaA [Flavobacterium sp.]|uniref:peroxide stress protein YaaA n=1 Tax=Flavobacterium sp. TaxID=239 RepID=UPI0037503929